MLRLFLFFSALLFSLKGFSQENTSHELADHIVYYNVFNSSMLTPEIAKTYNLIRANDRVYINIAVVKKSGGNGIAANISGAHRNLMQQKFPLAFVEINEATATYYLAPIRFNNEEILHIDINVKLDGETKTNSFTITKKLYRD
jgi:hypothetical protein